MMTAAIQVISYLNEIINFIQLRARSSSWKAWNIRRLAICESFIYLKFPPNLLFKSTFHLRTVYNKNVFLKISLTYLISYSLYKFISREQRTKFTSHYFFTILFSGKVSINYFRFSHVSLFWETLSLYTVRAHATTIGCKVLDDIS